MDDLFFVDYIDPAQDVAVTNISHLYNSSAGNVTLSSGLISQVNNAVPLVGDNAVQATVANRPQHGYYDAAVYNVDTLSDGLVTTWNNTNNGGAGGYGEGALSESTNKPTKASGELVFAQGNRFIRTPFAKVYEAFTVECYVWLDTVASVSSFQQAFAFMLNNNNFLAYTLSPSTNKYYLEWLVSDGTTAAYCIKSYTTLAGFNANLAGRWLHVVGTYNKGRSALYVDGTLVQSQSCSQSISVSSTLKGTINNAMSVSTLRVRYAKSFSTGVSTAQVALMYANRDTYTYQLPRQGFYSESGDSLNVTQTLGSLSTLTVGGFLKLHESFNPTTTTTWGIVGNKNGNNGFALNLLYDSGTTNITLRFIYGNGTTTEQVDYTISKTSFLTLAAGKWVYVAGSFGSGFKSVCLNTKVNSQTSSLSTITSPSSSDITLFGVEGNYMPTGCVFEQMLYYPGTLLSATQLEVHRRKSISTFTYLNN